MVGGGVKHLKSRRGGGVDRIETMPDKGEGELRNIFGRQMYGP